ncbi:hypothetical protein MPTK1_7g10290 [Marchantia polymorpha subsp. ruderalis]|uniref:Uncharacterized protein n=3 Tax=Marchantia polymorpha TaxID=3197 RepID=A0AAF6BY21_MARPO|nr:hypothetical protein MARPO_0003s0049 [Marchantia polymorpha]BBN16905.1 hypothetical protein Mp_7g10290 [Marchantia polymorpha subsp. ruderalis]|eukprot:PTQ49146.1 hypothetical protein MARPO_0003s0049 [Marchantia polymorpha]
MLLSQCGAHSRGNGSNRKYFFSSPMARIGLLLWLSFMPVDGCLSVTSPAPERASSECVVAYQIFWAPYGRNWGRRKFLSFLGAPHTIINQSCKAGITNRAIVDGRGIRGVTATGTQSRCEGRRGDRRRELQSGRRHDMASDRASGGELDIGTRSLSTTVIRIRPRGDDTGAATPGAVSRSSVAAGEPRAGKGRARAERPCRSMRGVGKLVRGIFCGHEGHRRWRSDLTSGRDATTEVSAPERIQKTANLFGQHDGDRCTEPGRVRRESVTDRGPDGAPGVSGTCPVEARELVRCAREADAGRRAPGGVGEARGPALSPRAGRVGKGPALVPCTSWRVCGCPGAWALHHSVQSGSSRASTNATPASRDFRFHPCHARLCPSRGCALKSSATVLPPLAPSAWPAYVRWGEYSPGAGRIGGATAGGSSGCPRNDCGSLHLNGSRGGGGGIRSGS